MPKSGEHRVNTIDSFFRVRPSAQNIREGESISFLEDGKLIKQEKRNGVVYEQIYVEQNTSEKQKSAAATGDVTNLIVQGSSSGGADITGITAGTGLTGGGASGNITLAIDSTVTTLTGTQTLTNKTLTSPVINTGVSGTAILDEDTMSSDSDTKLATQQSIKAYVDTEIAAVPSPADATITLSPGAGIAAIGNFTTNQSSNETLTIGVDGVLEDLDAMTAVTSANQFIVSTAAGTYHHENATNARLSLGLGDLAIKDEISDGDIVSDASIAITKLAANTISGVTLGNNLNALTLGSGLNFDSGSSYTGATARQISIGSLALSNFNSDVIIIDSEVGSVTRNDSRILTSSATESVIESYGYTTNTGTVTSVAVAGGNGLTSSGGPITSSGTITLAVGSDTLSVSADKVDLSASALTAVSDVVGSDGFIFFDASATPANSPRLGTVSDLPFTNNAGTITSVTGGSGLTGSGSSGGVTLAVGAGTGITVNGDNVALSTAGAGAGTYGSTTNSVKIDTITLDAYGRVTAVSTGGTGDISNVIAGTGLIGGGSAGDVTLDLDISGLNTINESQTAAASDTILIYDNDADEHKQMTLEDLEDAIAGNQTITLSGDVSGSGTTSISVTVADDSHNHIISNVDGLQTALDGKTPYDHFRSLGTPAFTAGGGSNNTITTAQYISEMEGDGAFDSYTSAFKTTWSYAGNDNLSDAGSFGPTETAGMSHLTWTDNASDSTRGNITVLAIAPNTGGSAGGVYIYNDQGSSYSPGWREVWTSRTDGSGSGLDADLLDGLQGSHYLDTNNHTGTVDIDRIPTATSITNGDIDNVATADVIYDFVTGQGYLTSSSTQSKYLRSDTADTANGIITFSAGMVDNRSNVGSVGSTGLESNQLSTTDWSNLPVGFGGMTRSGNQSYGNPGSNYFLFHKIANRDAGGGWGGIAVGYNNNEQFYVGTTTVSSSYATWSRVVVEDSNGHATISGDLKVGATGKIYLDGGGNTYITEEVADQITLRAGGGNYFKVSPTNGVVVNDPGANVDFRVEGDTDQNLIFADASADRVGIGTNSPQRKLHVSTGNTDIAARFENTSSNGTVMELLASGDSTTMYFQTDHIYSSSNLYLGAGTKITNYRASEHRFQYGSSNTESVRIASNGRLIVGSNYTTNASTQLVVSATGANGLLLNQDAGNTANSGRLFFEGTSTSAIFQSGSALSFRTGATTGSSSGTQRFYIDSSGTTFTGDVNVDGNTTMQSGHYIQAWNESSYDKFRLYRGSGAYAIGMYSGNTYGGLNDWAMTFTFNDDADRGFLWRDTSHGTNGGAMALTTNGKATIAHSLRVGYGETDTTTPGGTSTLEVAGNVDLRSDNSQAARFLHLPRSGGITLYGDASQHHGIFSRNDSNTNNQDDILITSYGAVYIDLDSNNNNTSEASFEIGRHNTANDPFFKIDGETGRVGISESSIDAMLHINPGNALCNIKLERAGVVAWRFGINTSSADLRFDAGSDNLSGPEVLFTSSGAGHFDNDVVAFSSSTSSDRRLKENIKPIPYGLETVLKMNPVEYDWKEKRDKAHDIGVIAQEVEELIPEIVKEHKDLKTDEPIKTVDYGKMVSVLIKAVQEQQEQINELKEKLNG